MPSSCFQILVLLRAMSATISPLYSLGRFSSQEMRHMKHQSAHTSFSINAKAQPVFFMPTSAEDVAKALQVAGGCTNQVALRSGGHSPNPGFSNTDHGFTIDLRGLNEIQLHENIVSVGTGAVWSEVYEVLDPLNRTVVGSRVASVGLGGFITGGKSPTSPMYFFLY
ncbi:hypothetical protein F4779DRAFT_273344 [Xylariaceae sp. FL0662B]|nr:hypothetical protein F4779DRAFT_273344 [Xylariaceae sp. FL0662B]